MSIKAVLYDAGGNDREVSLEDIRAGELTDRKLLWIDLCARDRDLLDEVSKRLELKDIPCDRILSVSRRPELTNFEQFFTVSIDSIATTENEPPARVPIDYVVGPNFVISIHDRPVPYFEELKEREKGETLLGELDAESFIAALLDLHIVSYFRAIEFVEERVDELDEQVISRDLTTDEFLAEMVKLRRWISDMRRWLMPHRELVYAFARSDYQHLSKSQALEDFKILSQHFEGGVAGIDSAREKVMGTFSLYATKSDQIMNQFIQKLTVITFLAGILGVLAGILGMNFHSDIFEMENGLWFALGTMALIAIVLTVIARRKHWI